MKALSSSLLAAQKKSSRTPCIKLTASNTACGVTRLSWQRLYEGSEDDYYHAMTLAGDGSMIRVRITPPSDSRKLYRQRVANPNPESDFSQWDYCNQYNSVIVAIASLGAEVSIFWIKSDRKIQRLKSTDYGSSWSSPELIDYSPTTAINGIAAAYKPNGDLALFFADQSTLYVKEFIDSQWQTKQAWDKSTGNLSGVAATYDGSYNLFITGQDQDDNYHLWSITYSDSQWSELKSFARAPAGGNYRYQQAFLDKPDVHRAFFIEKYDGTQAYSHPFWSHSTTGSQFTDNLWREPEAFNLGSEYGLAIAHHGEYCWLSSASSVWRALLTPQEIELAADVTAIKQQIGRQADLLTAELSNEDGRYNSPGNGDLAILETGSQLKLSPGYITSQGEEFGGGICFMINYLEHSSSSGKASLILSATGGWSLLENWRARHQFRWNKDTQELSVKEIVAFVLSRVGIRLNTKSQSSLIGSLYPDFSINPGDRGDTLMEKLLSLVPDVIFLEGSEAYLVNPQATDSSSYSYGSDHDLFEGSYRRGMLDFNHIQVEGYDAIGDTSIITHSYNWAEIGLIGERLKHIEDRNIGSVSESQDRGEACLRKLEIASGGGFILVPVNCGQELYDVVDITDSRVGLNQEKWRILSITLNYLPGRGRYRQHLLLGNV